MTEIDYHDAHRPYLSAVADALTAAGVVVLDWSAEPNDPRDGSIQIQPIGALASHDEVWICWQEERAWFVLTIDERPDGRESAKFVHDMLICTVSSPETVVNVVIQRCGLDRTALADSFEDLDFSTHEFDIDDPAFEAALAAYAPSS